MLQNNQVPTDEPRHERKPFWRRIPGFRSGKPWKMVVASLFYGFLLLSVIGLLVPTSETPTPPKQEQKQEQTPVQKQEQKQEEKSAPKSGETLSPKREPVIPGLMPADIKLNLESTWKLKFTGPQKGVEFVQYNGQAIDPDTRVTLMSNIFGTSPLDIRLADFIVDASLVAGSISDDMIDAVTEGYFGYCATVPYDGADPQKAKQWVEANARKAVTPGQVFTTQIGSVKFEMFGTKYMRTLRIKPAQ